MIRAAWRKQELRPGRCDTGCYTSRHIARFILVALYTGTRAGAVCSATLIPTIGRGHINLETGQFRRLAYGKQESNKRQPTIDLPPRLLAHIRRWHRLGISTKAVVECRGNPVQRVNHGWDGVVMRAGLKTTVPQNKVIPHTLRHTAISWYLRSVVPIDRVSDYCGVSIPIIKKVYGHHIKGWSDGILQASGGLADDPYQLCTSNSRNGREQNATGCNKVKQNQPDNSLESRDCRDRGNDRRDAGEDGGRKVLDGLPAPDGVRFGTSGIPLLVPPAMGMNASCDFGQLTVRESAMYAAIRQGKAKAGQAEELARRIKEGAIPIISDVEGFMGYYVVYAPDDTVIAISLFNNYAAAEESNKRALAWIETDLAPLLTGPATAMAGPVIVHTLA